MPIRSDCSGIWPVASPIVEPGDNGSHYYAIWYTREVHPLQSNLVLAFVLISVYTIEQMSDFSDIEDKRLVQLAHAFEVRGSRIKWDEVARKMKGSKHSNTKLAMRLKTLKNRHGPTISAFPQWYFSVDAGSASINLDRSTKPAECARQYGTILGHGTWNTFSDQELECSVRHVGISRLCSSQ